MKKYILLLLILYSFTLSAQVNLTNIVPGNESVNVPLSTIISVTFDSEIDTLKGLTFFENYFTNIYSQDSSWYSEDLKSAYLKVSLDSNKNYYFLLYSVPTPTREKLLNPTVVYFTTASAMTGYTVSGNILADENSGLDFSKTLVALSTNSIGEGEPVLEIGAIANSLGEYSIPYVQSGMYYPLAGNDANNDGRLDPSGGDAFSFLDQLTISEDINDLNFFLDIPEPLTLLTAFQMADSLTNVLFSGDLQLKRISTWNTDTLGNAGEWEFYFISDTLNKVSRLRVDRFGHNLEERYDEWEYQSLSNMDVITNLQNSVALSTFVENAEAAGGRDFRMQNKPANMEFNLELMLADHRYSYLSDRNPDTTQHIMWAALYRWYNQISEDDWEPESELSLFGDFETGAILLTEVKQNSNKLPTQYHLDQNYPNPFNPTTTISYSIANRENVKLVIYDILGNKIQTLVDGERLAGSYKIKLDASEYPTGAYFYQLKTNNYISTKKMLLLK